MSDKRLALVGYAPNYFLPFAIHLEENGFTIYWIVKLRSEFQYLLKNGVSASRILDTTLPDSFVDSIDDCYERLADLEKFGGPRIRDIILMDRMLRHKKTDFAIRYLGHLERLVTCFLAENCIAVVSSGRDTALQVLSLLVCRKLGVTWVVPTRTRLPKERYGFCNTHDSQMLLAFREVKAADFVFAEKFLAEFRTSRLKPAFKRSAGSLKDVLFLIPTHATLFLQALQSSVVDCGNDYTRYTIPKLVKMYLRRRLNLLQMKLLRPYDDTVGKRPYFLYALHTQPESSIDVMGSYFSDQLALINQIARATPTTHDLYVKVHQSDIDGRPLAFYRALKKIPGVNVIGPYVDSRDLIENADLVFTVTGTIGFEAGLLHIPVITFTKNFFNVLPSVHYCDSISRLAELITKILSRRKDTSDDSEVVQFLAAIHAASFPGEVNRNHTGLNDLDLKALVLAYGAIFDKYAKNA